MRPFHRTLLTMLVLAAMPWGAGAQTLYKSVGADGRVVYSDKPPVTGAVEKTMKLENLPVSVVPGASPAPQAAAAPDAPPAATPRGDVVLYMATWCGYCKAAKSYLAGKGIAANRLFLGAVQTDAPATDASAAPASPASAAPAAWVPHAELSLGTK